MNKFEKLENTINLVPPKSKADIPVYPMLITYSAVPTGRTQADIFKSNDAWRESLIDCYKEIGVEPDAVFPMCPGDVAFIEQLKARLPGKELGDNELFQFLEEEIMTMDDYHTIIKKGYGAWQMPFVASIQNPPVTGPLKTLKMVGRFINVGKGVAANRKYWESQGIPLMFHNGTAPPFDTFSMSRRMETFFYDVFDEPDLVKKACDASMPDILKNALRGAKKGDRIAIFAMRSSATFVSPAMFEEFALPYLRQFVDAFQAKGVTAVLHADGNWLPMLHYFKDFPKSSLVIELDGDTDIKQAKEILKGHQCIRGDVPASILAFGSEKETKDYCDMLVDLAMEGGLIVGSGCEVPLNAKLENMRVLMECTKA